MNRKRITGPAYTTKEGLVLESPPLCIIVDENPYPRVVTNREWSDHSLEDANSIRDRDPDTEASTEVVFHKHTLYHPTTFETLGDALSEPHMSVPPKAALDNNSIITLHDTELHHTSLEDLSNESILHYMESTECVRLESSDLTDDVVVPRESLDAWVADDRVEFLIPLEITNRAYQRPEKQ